MFYALSSIFHVPSRFFLLIFKFKINFIFSDFSSGELDIEIECPRECDHMCILSNYGPVCACREGYRLYDDLRTCVLTEGIV